MKPKKAVGTKLSFRVFHFILPLFLVVFVQCTKSLVEFDHVYSDAYKEKISQSLRTVEINDNFARLFKMSVYRLDGEMQKLLIDRHQDLYQELKSPSFLQETRGLGFVVQMEAPEENRFALVPQHRFRIVLEVDGQQVEPTLVQRLGDKIRTQAYFPETNEWSEDAFLFFPGVDPNQVGPQVLRFYHQDAKVSMEWGS